MRCGTSETCRVPLCHPLCPHFPDAWCHRYTDELQCSEDLLVSVRWAGMYRSITPLLLDILWADVQRSTATPLEARDMPLRNSENLLALCGMGRPLFIDTVVQRYRTNDNYALTGSATDVGRVHALAGQHGGKAWITVDFESDSLTGNRAYRHDYPAYAWQGVHQSDYDYHAEGGRAVLLRATKQKVDELSFPPPQTLNSALPQVGARTPVERAALPWSMPQAQLTRLGSPAPSAKTRHAVDACSPAPAQAGDTPQSPHQLPPTMKMSPSQRPLDHHGTMVGDRVRSRLTWSVGTDRSPVGSLDSGALVPSATDSTPAHSPGSSPLALGATTSPAVCRLGDCSPTNRSTEAGTITLDVAASLPLPTTTDSGLATDCTVTGGGASPHVPTISPELTCCYEGVVWSVNIDLFAEHLRSVTSTYSSVFTRTGDASPGTLVKDNAWIAFWLDMPLLTTNGDNTARAVLLRIHHQSASRMAPTMPLLDSDRTSACTAYARILQLLTQCDQVAGECAVQSAVQGSINWFHRTHRPLMRKVRKVGTPGGLLHLFKGVVYSLVNASVRSAWPVGTETAVIPITSPGDGRPVECEAPVDALEEATAVPQCPGIPPLGPLLEQRGMGRQSSVCSPESCVSPVRWYPPDLSGAGSTAKLRSSLLSTTPPSPDPLSGDPCDRSSSVGDSRSHLSLGTQALPLECHASVDTFALAGCGELHHLLPVLHKRTSQTAESKSLGAQQEANLAMASARTSDVTGRLPVHGATDDLAVSGLLNGLTTTCATMADAALPDAPVAQAGIVIKSYVVNQRSGRRLNSQQPGKLFLLQMGSPSGKSSRRVQRSQRRATIHRTSLAAHQVSRRRTTTGMSEVSTDDVRQPPAGDTTGENGNFLASADYLPALELRDGPLLASTIRIPPDNTDGGGNACNQICVSLMNIDCNPDPSAPVKLIPVGTEELLPCNHSRKHIATMSSTELRMHAHNFLAELSRRGLPQPVCQMLRHGIPQGSEHVCCL